jgi:hypothetical protein
MPAATGQKRRVSRITSAKELEGLRRGDPHPHEKLITELAILPREDVHSIMRVIVGVWSLQDRAAKSGRKRPRVAIHANAKR